jgi:hypothetical protein
MINLLFRGPIETQSGYGAHARDLLKSLKSMDLFDIKIDSCMWGINPMTALEDNDFHNWIKENIITSLSIKPDVYVTVTVPSEFRPVGNFNIGITAGVETTVVSKDFIDGCNKMDLIIVPSTFTRDVFYQTVYNEFENDRLIKQHKVIKPIIVLFEGVDTEIFKKL